ncbi:penicillin-binding transpeptidase domain-containing protein [Aureispira anguillae]|uniref:Beta-lactamase n=1 Tax=Aureispira anguillae TaxID=2864201 RepID=A0A915YEZ6_9BACT|nr:penicillin-binding transpeptidase domain-containing protein [Aureispira anguillae]BDS11820.1 penicillin-binding transpeptidase domain-containing protein [Aureispira anguillae]
MKPFLLLLIPFICICVSCTETNESAKLDLDALYKEYAVEGCFLLKSLNSKQLYVYNSNRCLQGFLPASTFKIVNSITALETGVATDENMLIKWDSVVRQIAVWNQDHTMKTAFKVSCVPYYQEIARRIGPLRMQEWVNKLQFGKMDIRKETISDFWLKGKSTVTPYQQLDFIERLANNELPIKPSTQQKMRDIMVIASDSSGMVMRGKTGWAIDGNRNIGWFVGYIERPDGERFVFVNNIEAAVGAIKDNDFMMCRKTIVGKVLGDLGVI